MNYLTEKQLYFHQIGRVMTDQEILDITPKRDREGRIDRLNNSTRLYILCDICGRPECVNCKWEDGKPRTPKYKDFVICINCDPRHPDDRWMKEGYRIFSGPKLKIVQIAQVARQAGKWECRNPAKLKCNCASCVSKKLFPPF